MFEKLTYSGTECNSYLYFAFDAEYFDTDTVTNELKIEPTATRVKNDPVPKTTSWKYRLEPENDFDLETPLERMLDIFESKIAIINQLKEKFNLTTRLQFVIDINPEASTPYFGFNNRTIDFLSKTGTTVDFDLYKADTIGLLDGMKER